MYVSGPNQMWTPRIWAAACSTVWTTFDEVHVIVGTMACALALVTRLVLM